MSARGMFTGAVLAAATLFAFELATVRAEEPAAPGAAKDAFPVFPHADEGADPAVTAEQGGKGFTGEGWRTNTTYDLVGDPRAIKGGRIVRELTDFPNNLRPEGPAANTAFNYLARDLMFDGLLFLHPTTLEWAPAIATHWRSSEDGQTYWYRLNPNARWADGTPITSEDVIATWEFRVDPDLSEPSSKMTYEKFEKPVAESKYIVRVKCVTPNWRNFIYFSGMHIFQAKELRAQPVKEWLDKYNFRYMIPSGPYYGEVKDIDKDKQIITLRRRKDYWAADHRRNVGLYNFDELTYVVISDDNIAFESLKKGDIDLYVVSRAKMWVEETDFPNVQRGLVQKRKIFNEEPRGTFGIALNMSRPPFDDVRVRKAFSLLLDRKKLLDKLMYNQYLPLNSYYPAGEYENSGNPKNEYNPDEAQKLLAEAGWKEVDDKGHLLKDGKPLEVELTYDTKTFEKHLTVYQEDLANAGISATLRLVTPETRWKLMTEKNFQMTITSWGALVFPNPETSYHSRLAQEKDNNNVTGVADPRIDALCAKYDKTVEQKDRAAIIQEIDGILAQAYPYVLLWYGPYTRVLYWNKFGVPESGMPRVGDSTVYEWFWWFDPAKAAALDAAKKDAGAKLEVGGTEVHYWEKRRGAR
ncbi:MAG: ABC transporter substrate-binding protein [Planctomycetes bacterium]|nr:ABC transporter substrate-binding protein [Planctomycetota bacterium]